MPDNSTVSVVVVGGPKIEVPWLNGMTAVQAMRAAIDQTQDQQVFTYSLQYFSGGLGDMVVMINQTYDTIGSKESPYYYWDILVNGQPAQKGVDTLVLNQGDELKFQFAVYQADAASAVVQMKHKVLSRR